MRREKNYKTARLIEALEYIDVRFIEEAAEKIKTRPTGQVFYGTNNRKKMLRQILSLAACVLLLSAAIPAITYLSNHLPDIIAAIRGDETTETDPELTHPETPPDETTVLVPETTEETTGVEHDTTAPLYDGTTAEPGPEHNGSYGLEYKMNEDGKSAMLFHRGICTDENVIVASVWNGVPVTFIGEAAFADYIKYKTITIPESVTAIDIRAFKNCTGLESVVLHDGISYIGADAFENCTALKEITLPKSLEWIQTGLFMNCINLEKVIIGNEVERIVFGAFYDCFALRELNYLGTKAEWNKIQKDLTWNTKSAITVVHCSDGDVEITPYNLDEVVYDGSRGLEYKVNNDGKTASLFGIGTCTDTEIIVATTYNGLPVTEIFYSAFNGNSQIVSVIIPEGVTYIDKLAFANCSALESIQLPSSIQNFGEAETFKNCTALKTIVLPDGMNYLGVETFMGCTSLESIVMEGVGSIDISAFEDCAKLNNIVISGKCIEISNSAFKNCRSLTKFSFSGTVNEWMKLAKGNEWNEGCAFTEVRCLDGNANSYLIPDYDGSRGLEYEIELFNGNQYAVLIGIGTCTDKDIVVATTYNGLPVTEIGDYALYNCDFLESVTVPEGVTNIQNEAFYLCKNLKKVTLPSTLEYIRDWAFASCENLESIRVPDSVKWIGQRAFSDCVKLSSLTLGKGAEQIQESAFENCTSLKSVDFPRSLKLLAADAFSGCTKLSDIMYSGSVGEWSEVDSTGRDYYYQSFTWHDGVPAEKIRCSDGDVYLYALTEADAIESARKFWNLPSNAVLFAKDKSLAYPYCYKIAYCEPNSISVINGGFAVKREVFVDQRTGECKEVVYDYPNIPEVFLNVIFNREKFIYVEQTADSNGEYKYTTSEALLKDHSARNGYVFGVQTLWYYLIDIDGDSIPELVFPGSARSHYGMLFRVYEGKVYGYACILDGLLTDATYRWHEQAGNYVGRSQVYFDGIFYKSRRLTECDKNDPNNIIYYVEGKETTKGKYEEFESAFSNEELESYQLDYYPVYVNPFPGG